ncbi:MAG: hypothetical protein ACXV3C_14350 [Actinomycetes bacterium]
MGDPHMVTVLVILSVVLVLVMGLTLIGAGTSRVRRRVVVTPVRRRRTVVEDVMEPGVPTTTRRVVEYE